MGTSIKRRKRIGKILVLLLASGSLLGISPLAAMAADVVITVTVDDNTPDTPECSMVDIPDWSPNETPITGLYDLADPSLAPTQGFVVFLNFSDGFDDCAMNYEPAGDVRSSFLPAPDTGLNLSSMECLDAPCDATDLSNDGNFGELSGAFFVPATTGTYSGTLTITWTP
jgi:hypothetical protein